MKCPECHHMHSRVIDTKRTGDCYRRYRVCCKCSFRFGTIEQVAEWDPVMGGYAPVAGDAGPELLGRMLELVPSAEPAPEPKKPRGPARFVASTDDDRLVNVCAEAQPLLVQWWNESRWSKHKAKATWTETSWEMCVERVAALAKPQQLQLARAGVENGWQTLKYEYLDGARPIQLPSAAGRPMPRDPAMLAALDSWPGTAA